MFVYIMTRSCFKYRVLNVLFVFFILVTVSLIDCFYQFSLNNVFCIFYDLLWFFIDFFILFFYGRFFLFLDFYINFYYFLKPFCPCYFIYFNILTTYSFCFDVATYVPFWDILLQFKLEFLEFYEDSDERNFRDRFLFLLLISL